MPVGVVPESFLGLLAAFAGCFTAQGYRTFELLVVGWVHCLGRRTITAVALASGAVGWRHISVFHRSGPPSPPRRQQNAAFSWPDAVLATA